MASCFLWYCVERCNFFSLFSILSYFFHGDSVMMFGPFVFDTLRSVTVFIPPLEVLLPHCGSTTEIDCGYIMSLLMPPVGCLLMLLLAIGIYLWVVLTRQWCFVVPFHWVIVCLFVVSLYELFCCHNFLLLYINMWYFNFVWEEFYACCCTLCSCFRYIHLVAVAIIKLYSYIISIHPMQV